MSEIKDGGPAFPLSHSHIDLAHTNWSSANGMTLRDHFAAKVAPAIYADLTMKLLESGKLVENVYEIVAIASYEMADAMLRARGAA